ncbi:MAG: phosphoglucosamine mutase [Saprospiraceae bacterium]
MALIKSISGIRGTIGGRYNENLTAQDIVECTAAFGYWTIQKTGIKKIVVGRDARISGELASQLVISTLRMVGITVIDLDYSTTPTVEIAVPLEKAGAGIILTASHNPRQWNALKFLNEKGEFISKSEGQDVLDMIASNAVEYADVDNLGRYVRDRTYIKKHIQHIIDLPLVDQQAVIDKQYKVIVDVVNSTGAISVPNILTRLGCEVIVLNTVMDGDFAHNPEPLPENLEQLAKAVKFHRANLGIAVDPDVDRLAFVCENGKMFGEEYTLVAVADYILQHNPGNTVSNLSSTRALRDVTEKHGGKYFAAAVGEVNVVTQMKAQNAVIGGEGNGGVIYPKSHYGRDALVGIAMVMTYMAKSGKSLWQLRKSYPDYTISKNKIELTPDIDLEGLLATLQERYKDYPHLTIDGLKIEFDNDWVHMRKSNTEPIIRIYTESKSKKAANALAEKFKKEIREIIG